MRCDRAREGLSALLDDEDPGVDRQALEQHLVSCPGCRRWREQTVRINRMVRIRPADPADIAPDLASRMTPPRRTRRVRPLLQIALLLVALAQLAVGVVALLPPLAGGVLDAAPVIGGVLPGMTGHLGNESAAFNIAIGIALLWIAAHPHRARGPLPLLMVFVVVLTGLEILDHAAGRVGWDRLPVHLPVIAGLILAAALTRLRPPTMPTPEDSAATDSPWDARYHPQQPNTAQPADREQGQRPPTARRDIA